MKKIIILCVLSFVFSCNTSAQKKEKKEGFTITKTDSEWKAQLSDEAYYVLRKEGTERPFTSPLNKNYKEGIYHCAACNTPLFKSEHKFDSGTGWPSFTQPMSENAIGYIKDTSFGMIRVEVICNTCDAHLGHVFPDGPEPSGLRYCINSASMQLEKSPV